MRQIRGKRALITGAASGIGRAIALALAEEGADVCLIDINERGLKSVASEAELRGVRALPILCDVSRKDEIVAAVNELQRTWGGLEILVNNAGVVHYGPTNQMSDDHWERILTINLLAPIHFTRLLFPILLREKEVHLVNVSSMYGYFATRNAAAYHTTKYALLGLTESLRAELSRQGIGVTAICPGFVATNLFDEGTAGDEYTKKPRPPRWLCTTPENVARKTIRAIYSNRRLVLATPFAYAMYYLKGFAPWLLDWAQHWGAFLATKKRLRRLAEENKQGAPATVEKRRDAA
jgi:short-subunit dehydrogenase